MRQIFDLVDRNSDGTLVKKELLMALKKYPAVRALFDLASSDLQEIQNSFEDQGQLGKAEKNWSDIDINGHKRISWDEFNAHFSGKQSQALAGIALLSDAKKIAQDSKPKEYVIFVPSKQWQDVPKGAVCPKGLEYKMDMSTGINKARLC